MKSTVYLNPESAPARRHIWEERPDTPAELFSGIIDSAVGRLLTDHTDGPRSEIRGIVRASCGWLVSDYVDYFIGHAIEASEIAWPDSATRWPRSRPRCLASPPNLQRGSRSLPSAPTWRFTRCPIRCSESAATASPRATGPAGRRRRASAQGELDRQASKWYSRIRERDGQTERPTERVGERP